MRPRPSLCVGARRFIAPFAAGLVSHPSRTLGKDKKAAGEVGVVSGGYAAPARFPRTHWDA